jgi:hypothetical protein
MADQMKGSAHRAVFEQEPTVALQVLVVVDSAAALRDCQAGKQCDRDDADVYEQEEHRTEPCCPE